MDTNGGSDRRGFTLVELIVAMSLLAITFLGMGSVVPALMSSTSRSEIDFLTLNAVEDRLDMILMDPRYTLLDSIYSEESVDIGTFARATRTTSLSRQVTTMPDGRTLDFTTVTVFVEAPNPSRSVSRNLIIGAP
jgi:prepilin-type N-terminal cleavage/methylation domain-containing protein